MSTPAWSREASYDYWKFQLEEETQSVISSLFLPLTSLNVTRKELLNCLKRLRRARYKLKDKVLILMVLTDYYVFASCLPGL